MEWKLSALVFISITFFERDTFLFSILFLLGKCYETILHLNNRWSKSNHADGGHSLTFHRAEQAAEEEEGFPVPGHGLEDSKEAGKHVVKLEVRKQWEQELDKMGQGLILFLALTEAFL